MNKDQLINYLEDNNLQKIKFAFTDIDGILRGKIIHKKKFLDGLHSGYGFCDVAFGWDSSDTLYDSVDVTGWHTGFPDKLCFIDPDTFRLIPWENNLPFFLADFSGNGSEQLPACPRSLLKNIIHECREMKFHAEFAQEFEWFNFRETPQSLQEKDFRALQTLSPGMFGYSILRPSQNSDFYHSLFDQLEKFDIPLEGLHTETGPGVYEGAILHDEVLRAADKAVLFKTSVKELASRHGLTASFMAKWNASLPGCSGHIHQSLWTTDMKKNVFFDGEDVLNMSAVLKHYIAGQLYCLPHILPMFAPTVNSYKRLIEGAWAPVNVTWGIDNRTTALRVLNTSEEYTRLETRVPGSDSNPYLAMAAALASGLYGIKNQLVLNTDITNGNAYREEQRESLPRNLRDAACTMRDSAVAADLFGKPFVEHFTATRLWEWGQFAKHVSDWELKRYFEII